MRRGLSTLTSRIIFLKSSAILCALMLMALLAPETSFAATTNLLFNSNFSQGMSAWYLASGSAAVIPDPTQPSNNILRLSGAEKTEVWQNVSQFVQAGSSYLLAAQGRISETPAVGSIGVEILDANDGVLLNKSVAVGAITFNPYQVAFTVPSNAESVKVYIIKSYGPHANLDAENFSLTQAQPLNKVQSGTWLAGCDTPTMLAAFLSMVGHPAPHGTNNFNQTSWAAFASSVPWAVNCNKPYVNQLAFTWGVPMLPADGVSTLAKGAAGAYDAYFTAMTQTLVQNGFGNAIIRVGWEFNGDWQPWASYKDPANFIKYYQRIVTLMRAVPGANFKFDWCPGLGTNALASEESYPGDAYVDYVGMDVYDAVWSSYWVDPIKRWNEYVTEPDGLQWQVTFAHAHNKLMSFPEWGVGGNSSGDNPYFVTQMATWAKRNGYSYMDYWDTNSAYAGELSNGQYPNAEAAFIAAFQ